MDTSSQEQMEYYENLLKEDGDVFKDEGENWTHEEVIKYCKDGKDILRHDCERFANILGIPKNNSIMDYAQNICHRMCGKKLDCSSCECLDLLADVFKKYSVVKPEKEENSCLAVNIIHIYKLTSAWVASIIRELETNENKLLTHAEITTEPLPNAIVIKK